MAGPAAGGNPIPVHVVEVSGTEPGVLGLLPCALGLHRLSLPRLWELCCPEGAGSWGCPRTVGGRWGPGLPLPGAPRVTWCRDPVAPSLCPGVPRARGQGWASLAAGSARAGDERVRSPRGKGLSGHAVSLRGQRGRGPGCPWRGDGLLAEYLNARCGLGEAACEFGSSWAADGNHPARPSRQRDLTRGVTALIVPRNGQTGWELPVGPQEHPPVRSGEDEQKPEVRKQGRHWHAMGCTRSVPKAMVGGSAGASLWLDFCCCFQLASLVVLKIR